MKNKFFNDSFDGARFTITEESDITFCSECSGKGLVKDAELDPATFAAIYSKMIPCPHCDGDGRIVMVNYFLAAENIIEQVDFAGVRLDLPRGFGSPKEQQATPSRIQYDRYSYTVKEFEEKRGPITEAIGKKYHYAHLGISRVNDPYTQKYDTLKEIAERIKAAEAEYDEFREQCEFIDIMKD